jgi:hypothetical protein
MAHITEDRIAETSTTTGTGVLTLAGAITGFRTFASVCATSDTCYYMIEAIDADGIPTGEWETGLGTYSGTNALTRTSVSRSSNANAAVNFSAGTKRVTISIIGASAGLSRTTASAAYNLSTQLSPLDNIYLPKQGVTPPATSASSSDNLSVTFTVSHAQTVSVDFFAILHRGGSGNARAWLADSTGTKVWPRYPQSPDGADTDASHGAIYSADVTTEGNGQTISFSCSVEVAAGTHTFVIFVSHALAVVHQYWYDRSLSVTYVP